MQFLTGRYGQPHISLMRALPRTPADVPTMPDVAYAWLRDEILGGAMEEGQALRQESLAATLGVSRVPVREALRRLEVEGLVVQRPRRGYVVASLDPDEIEEIFDLRRMLEQRAGFLATQRRTAQDVAELEALLHRMDGMAIASTADIDSFAERNRAFHDRLFQPCGRAHLLRMMVVLRNNVERYIRVGALVTGSVDQVQNEHVAIFEAFRRGDAEEVGALCRLHCEHACERLVRRLRGRRRAP